MLKHLSANFVTSHTEIKPTLCSHVCIIRLSHCRKKNSARQPGVNKLGLTLLKKLQANVQFVFTCRTYCAILVERAILYPRRI